MKVLGNKFRETRKQQRLSQSALAEGVCTQATVSKIENKNRCESLDVFYSLCSKLGVTVGDYLVENQEQELEKILDQVEHLCNLFKHKEAYEMLEGYGNVDIGNLNEYLQIKYLYYKGRTHSNGMGKCEHGLLYLNQAKKISKKLNIYTILIIDAIAVSYMINGDGLKKAQPYFKKAYQMLQEFPEEQHTSVSYVLYFNLAKYFSELKDYQKSIELCDLGIKLCKESNSNTCLDLLLYEKAYNEYYLNGTEEGYRFAYYFTKFNGNHSLLGCIENDLAKYSIRL